MDFFGEQARARQKTRWLVLLFALAVIAIVVAVYLAVTLVFGLTGNGVRVAANSSLGASRNLFHGDFWDASRFFWTFAIVGGTIVIASLYKIRQISRMGGVYIAIELGGRPIPRETKDPLERRLVNVIDEISIAAGIPVPQVFVLDDEPGLNAFAAGMNTGDSVVAVTRGLLDKLDRDQLQGVIGHEISHIVNGDSRLNLKIAGILHGIFFLTLTGRILSRARGRNAQAIFTLGILLFLVGSIGLFFGRLIQAAVSREREYLADASAVQFTRNPEGLAGALRHLMLSGSGIQNPKAGAASHFFFGDGGGNVFRFFSPFATHPPLEKRIARIDRNFNPAQLPKQQAAAELQAELPDMKLVGANFLSGIGAFAPAQFEAAQILLATLPEPLMAAAHHAEAAQTVAYALLLSRSPEIQTRQLEALGKTHSPELAKTVLARAREILQEGARCRLPLLDLALPSLRELAPEARDRFLAMVDALIQADGRVSASEFALRQILKSVLTPRKVSRASLKLERLNQDITVVLAMLAYVGNVDKTAAAAFHHAVALAPSDGPWVFPDKKALRPEVMEAALEHLAHATPRFREKLLAACVAVVEHDARITVAEAELLRALAQSLDCPAPPVFPGDKPET
jgi:Zn-dependent protease with chaperone function